MATHVEKVRVQIGDPDDGSSEISTGEIETLLEIHNNHVKKAAAAAAINIAAKYALKTDLSGGGASAKNSQKHTHWMDIARSLGANVSVSVGPVVSGISQSEMAAVEADRDRVPSRIG